MINTKYNLIGERYAEALVDMVQDGRLSYEKVLQDVNTIGEIFSMSKDLEEFLKNPVASKEDKKEVVQKVFSEDIDTLMVNFLKVLVDQDRIQAFPEIVDKYKSSLDNINNVKRVSVTSAVTVSDEARSRLKSKLEEKMQKAVTIDWLLDSSIIAGLVIKMGDDVIDTSLRHKLEDLGKVITK
jgi:F-type H+-transporting ATPase subunit delta